MVKVEGSGAGFATCQGALGGELGGTSVGEGSGKKGMRNLKVRGTPVEHKIGVTRQTKVDGPIDTYKQTETVIESNEVWTVGLRPVAVRDSAGAKDIVLYGYRSQRDSSSQWGAVKAEGSFAGAPEGSAHSRGSSNQDEPLRRTPQLVIRRPRRDAPWEELNSRSKASPPEVTNLSFDLLNWRNLRNMMLLQLGSAAGLKSEGYEGGVGNVHRRY
ncbi:hypothetical protein C8R42DRAFT_724214 [Lentinula raphanica]|nr:hypothetical protein C8R42DRAFT_724214 [Lentinula raphanica]